MSARLLQRPFTSDACTHFIVELDRETVDSLRPASKDAPHFTLAVRIDDELRAQIVGDVACEVAALRFQLADAKKRAEAAEARAKALEAFVARVEDAPDSARAWETIRKQARAVLAALGVDRG